MKTPIAAQKLGITYHRAMGLIRYGRIKPPSKDTSGDYDWSQGDLEAARKALGGPRPAGSRSGAER